MGRPRGSRRPRRSTSSREPRPRPSSSTSASRSPGSGCGSPRPPGPLLELGAIALDGIAVHLYGEATAVGLGGGVQAAAERAGRGAGRWRRRQRHGELARQRRGRGRRQQPSDLLAEPVDPEAPRPEQGSRSASAPAIRPGRGGSSSSASSVRSTSSGSASTPSKPDGKVTRISLLFSGSVSLFGLTAAVDQLSLNWNGGDVLVDQQLVGRPDGPRRQRRHGRGLARRRPAQERRRPTASCRTSACWSAGSRPTACRCSAATPATRPGHASFFVFGAVNGPIGGPPAFFLTGIGGGLGINRGLVIPTDLVEFGDYPFIQALDPAAAARRPDGRAASSSTPTSRTQPGNFWFAAGHQLQLASPWSTASRSSPWRSATASRSTCSASPGWRCRARGRAGVDRARPARALLHQRGRLLDPGAAHRQLVAALRGHPTHRRLRVRSSGGRARCRAVRADAWAATTPTSTATATRRAAARARVADQRRHRDQGRVVLRAHLRGADGRHSASRSASTSGGCGPSIEFGADGIVYFDPFWFDVRAYCRISAGIDIDLGLFSISLSLTLGRVDPRVGPDFAGEVRFEIGPCDGADLLRPPAATAPARRSTGRRSSPSTSRTPGSNRPAPSAGSPAAGTLPTSTGGGQGAPSADGSAELPFRVFAEFEVSFTSTIPVLTIAVGAATQADARPCSPTALRSAWAWRRWARGTLTSTLAVGAARTLGRAPGSGRRGIAKLAANLTAGSAGGRRFADHDGRVPDRRVGSAEGAGPGRQARRCPPATS